MGLLFGSAGAHTYTQNLGKLPPPQSIKGLMQMLKIASIALVAKMENAISEMILEGC